MITRLQDSETPTSEAPAPVLADRESCELLREVARRPTEANARRIASISEKIRDWNALFRLGLDHGMLPMLYLRLAEIGPKIPQAVLERLRKIYHRNAYQSIANAAELIRLLQAFDRESIAAMPFKGVVLAASVYPDPTSRPAGDLDVLIHHRHLGRATAILLESGYKLDTQLLPDGSLIFKSNQEYHFKRPADGMIVELRWRFGLVSSWVRRNLDIDWVWPGRRTAVVAGAEVPDMNPEIALLNLCRHGSKHVWTRLIWICDVARLLESESGLNWNVVIREAKRTGLRRALILGVLLAHRVAGAQVPQTVLSRFEADAVANRVARHIDENLFDAPGTAPGGHVLYNIQLLGFRDRLRLLFSLDLFRPDERDFEAFSFPKPLHALYWLVRPIRLLRSRSGR